MSKSVFINNQAITLPSDQLIQAGGEGMVFRSGGQTAVKIYHHPQPAQVAKLEYLLNGNLAGRLPTAVYAPTALAHNKQGDVVGFQMRLLPSGTLPLKKLGSLRFWKKAGMEITAVLTLLQTIHQQLTQLHAQNIVVGDLNDQNLLFTPAPIAPAWVDVDSYQLGGHACPVAMLPFLDPNLYHVADFSSRQYFSEMSDWYAYTVLLVKTLLQVHPYGGAHSQLKTVRARAEAGVSVLQTAVTYPKNARPLDSLSDELLEHLHLIFDKGERRPFSSQLLQKYADSLVQCPQCNLHYPKMRRYCPACRVAIPAPTPRYTNWERLAQLDGVVMDARVQALGWLHAIMWKREQYTRVRLGVGGVLDEVTLFAGRAGCRFAQFDEYIAVNPPQGGGALLLLRVDGATVEKVTAIETGLFRETAVFTSTPHHLYRIAGNWIMRGQVRDGVYLEDAIATAHRHQTQFWGSPFRDLIVGYHRVFAENRFFAIDEGDTRELDVAPLVDGESLVETAVDFTADSFTITLTIRANGQLVEQKYQL